MKLLKYAISIGCFSCIYAFESDQDEMRRHDPIQYHFDTIVVGAGPAGIGGAHYISKKFEGESIGVFSADGKSQIGGKVWSIKADGIEYDMGAKIILFSYNRVYELLNELYIK